MSVKEDAKAQVCRIHVVGTKNTRIELLRSITSPLFQANTVAELLNSVNLVRQHLTDVGVFSHVRAIIDVPKNGEQYSDPNYEVTLLIRERRRASASIRTELETNGMALRLGGRYLNATGRADQISAELIRGTHSENGYAFNYSIPLHGDINKFINFGVGKTSFENCMPFLAPVSTYRQRETFAYFGHEFNVPKFAVKYSVRAEHIWRRIEALQQTTPLALRMLEGDSVKSALRHFISLDTRDSQTLPTSGYLAKLSQEFALPPGDARNIKHEIELQYAHSIRRLPITVHGSVHAGHVLPIMNSSLQLPDRYFIGGPLTLRGFGQRGVGYNCTPSANAADGSSIGGSSFWVAALHFYAPLPFLGRPTVTASNLGSGEEEENHNSGPNPIQLHGFISAGDLASSNSQLIHSLSRLFGKNDSYVRVSAGAGVVMRIGSIARLEINYTFPLRAQTTDHSSPGFQFGIGVQFV